MAELKCEVQIDHPDSTGWIDITDKITDLEIDRGIDRRTHRTRAGVCRMFSVTADPWVGPWQGSSSVWYEGDLIGAPVRVMVTVYDDDLSFSSREIIYTGAVDEIIHETTEHLNQVSLTCLDMWGERIAPAYLDIPAYPQGSSTRTRFNELMEEAGFTVSTNFTGTDGLRSLAPSIAKPKQRLVQALQQVVDSENAYLFVDRFNVLHFIGVPKPPQATVGVSDTAGSTKASFVRTPQVILDTERLVNAVIVIADDASKTDKPYDESWGTASVGSVLAVTPGHPVNSIAWETAQVNSGSDYFALQSAKTYTSAPWGADTPWRIPRGTPIKAGNTRRYLTALRSAAITLASSGRLVVNAYTYDRPNSAGSIIQEAQLAGDSAVVEALAESVDYSVPWDQETGDGKGASGASETVRADRVSIGLHGRYERRQKTALRPIDTPGLADEILKERSELRPVVPDVEVAIDAESAPVARLLLELELDGYLEIEFTPRGQQFRYVDLSPIVRINYRIESLAMQLDRVRVTARYTLYRGVKPSWWQVGVSHLGTESVVGGSGLTATPGQWIHLEIVDVDGLARIANAAVSRYASDLSAEGTPAGVRYVVVGTALRRYNPATRMWRTIGTFR